MAKVKSKGKKSTHTGGSFLVEERGWYEVEITAEETRANSQKNGEHVSVEFTLKQGGKAWFILNIMHDEKQPRRIALEQLDHIVFCCLGEGKSISDTKKLVGKKLEVEINPEKVTKKQRKKGWKDKNAVLNFRPLEGKKGKDKPF